MTGGKSGMVSLLGGEKWSRRGGNDAVCVVGVDGNETLLRI